MKQIACEAAGMLNARLNLVAIGRSRVAKEEHECAHWHVSFRRTVLGIELSRSNTFVEGTVFFVVGTSGWKIDPGVRRFEFMGTKRFSFVRVLHKVDQRSDAVSGNVDASARVDQLDRAAVVEHLEGASDVVCSRGVDSTDASTERLINDRCFTGSVFV